MRNKINISMVGLFVLLIFLIMTNTHLVIGTQTEETTVTGTIGEAEWDANIDDDHYTAVEIIVVTYYVDSTGIKKIVDRFLVAQNEKGRELMQLVGKKVEATGTVETDADGNKTISVNEYKVIKD